MVFQYMCDSNRAECPFSFAHHSRYVALGSPSVHSHSTEDVDHEKTSLSNRKDQVNWQCDEIGL